jgi:two-component system, cell cycle response regulator DivK
MAGKRILVVDDNPINLRVTSIWASRTGFETRTADSAEKALDLLALFRPDLILTDVQMPGMDGLEFTRRVKAKAEWQTIPVFALTALESPDDEEKIREAGCDGYLCKPVDVKLLTDLIGSYFGPEALPAPPAPAAPEKPDDSMESLRAQFVREGAEQCVARLERIRACPHPKVMAAFFESREFRLMLHQWAGVGGSLGFPEITVKAREAEALIGQPIAQTAQPMREILENLLEMFTSGLPAQEAPLSLPAELSECLLGKRFALLNLEPGETQRLTALLEKADAFHRAVPLPVALSPKAFRAYDVILANTTNIGDAGDELLRCLAESALPLVLFGRSEIRPGLEMPQSRAPVQFLRTPCDARQALMCAATLLSRKEAAPSATPQKKPAVLIADDDPIVRALIKSALEPLGMECRLADNGQAALAMARNAPPDLAILDVNMPYKNGFDVLNSMRGYDRTKSVRVMILTASQEETDITRGLSFGANDYMIKPFDPVELAARVRRLLAQPR